MTAAAEQNRATMHAIYYEVVSEKRLDRLPDLLTPDVTQHRAGPEPIVSGVDGVRHHFEQLFEGIPDVRIVVDHDIATDDGYAAKWRGLGTHTGTLFGVPASGKEVVMDAVEICVMEGGRLKEFWIRMDLLGLLQQMGALPPRPPQD